MKHKGLGYRSHADILHGAFMGGLEQAIPHFALPPAFGAAAPTGFAPALGATVGANFFVAGAVNRWTTLLASGTRTGNELIAAHAQVQRQLALERAVIPAAHAIDYPDIAVEADDPSTFPIADFAGPCKGKVQYRMLQELERVRSGRWLWEAQRICRASVAPGTVGPTLGNDRPSRAFLYCQPHSSSQWVLALPTPHERLTNAQLAEIAAKFLGLPSPACAPLLGQPVAGKTFPMSNPPRPALVDQYGDCFHTVALGDGFRTRHDAFERALHSILDWATVDNTMEVYGLFAALIPQQGWQADQVDRKKQGLVPDFYIREGQGMDIQGLAEFKFIGCCPTRYPGAAGNTPVNRRAHQFQAEYERKARAVDTPAGVVLARLRSFGRIKGLVVGAYSEFSNDLIRLIKEAAAKKLGAALADDRNGAALILTAIRRRLGVTAARAQASIILDGVRWCGPGGAEAYARRNVANEHNRHLDEVAYAHHQAHYRGRANVADDATHAVAWIN